MKPTRCPWTTKSSNGGYTDDDGYFVILLDSPATLDQVDRVRILATTRPAGTGEGVNYVHRSVDVTPDTSSEVYSVTFFDTFCAADAALRDAAFWRLDIPKHKIGDADVEEQAFWVYDAMVTASRFHATLPDVSVGHVGAEFPADALGSYAYFGATHILANHYAEYDTVVHEYGHVVAQEADFFSLPSLWDLQHLNHVTEKNMRIYHDCECYYCASVTFNEGWANFYSVVGQVQQGVPPFNPYAPRDADPGDGKLYGYDPEPSSSGELGEDQEIAVMRLLWDLYDPANEPTDRIELGIDQLYRLCRDHHIYTVSALWNVLYPLVGIGRTDLAQAEALGEVFAEEGIGCTGLAASVGAAKGLSISWTSGDPAPTFEWRVPFAADANAAPPWELQLFDRFWLEFYEGDGSFIESVYSPFWPGTFSLASNLASVQLDPWLWDEIRGSRSQVYWTVVAGENFADDPTFQSGQYWSDDVGRIQIVP